MKTLKEAYELLKKSEKEDGVLTPIGKLVCKIEFIDICSDERGWRSARVKKYFLNGKSISFHSYMQKFKAKLNDQTTSNQPG